MEHKMKSRQNGDLPPMIGGGQMQDLAAMRAMQKQQDLQTAVFNAQDHDPALDAFTVEPFNDYVLLRRVAINVTQSGLIEIPEEIQKQFQLYEVLGVGTGHLLLHGERIPLDVKVGDIVMVLPNVIAQIHESKSCWFCKENQIVARFRKKLA